MQENKQQNVIDIICETIHILVLLSDVRKIIAYTDIEEYDKNKKIAFYQQQEYMAYPLGKLLHRSHEHIQYALLLQNEDIEVLLFVDEITGIISIDQPYLLPTYLKQMAYIKACYKIQNNQLAYVLDFIKLIEMAGEKITYGE